jgi:hypothetical protein
MRVKISNKEIQEILAGESVLFPKYTTQIINLANQNAQGTRPRVVGQMSDLIQEFDGKTLNEWREWYKDRMPDAIENATNKIYPMLENLKEAIVKVDKELVRKWVEDLTIIKTFTGLKFQEAVLSKVAEIKRVTHRLANPAEESKGIDGFIGDMAVSIKPITYKIKSSLSERIDVPIIYYDKKKNGILIEFDF